MSIASLFIRRPRLAFVISTVISIAGIIAMTAMPVAQFPDIVPPQVKVTAVYPGASAQAVEESVAQVIEAQVNGVERMIYMKSTSGGDGSYDLTVSFEVGSNPDLNTVNVTNRVNQAIALLPPEVQRNGVTTKKQSSALLQVVAVYSPKGTPRRACSCRTSPPSTCSTRMQPRAGCRQSAGAVRRARLCHARLARTSTACRASASPREDVVKAIAGARTCRPRSAASAPRRCSNGVDFQLNITAKGRLTSAEEFEQHQWCAPQSGGRAAAHQATSAGSNWARPMNSDQSPRATTAGPAAGIQIYQLAGANALATAEGVRKVAAGAAGAALPEDVAFDVMYDTTVFVEGDDPQRGEDPDRGLRAGRPSWSSCSSAASCATTDHPDRRRAGGAGRHLRGDAGAGLLGSTPCRCWRWCWPSASWSTTPSSWSRRSSTSLEKEPGLTPAEATEKAMGRGHRPRSSPSPWSCSRCSSRPPSCRASRASSTQQFAVDDLGRHGDLGDQRAVAVARAVLAHAASPAAARRAA